MITAALLALMAHTPRDPEVLPPAPTLPEALAEFERKRPGARIVASSLGSWAVAGMKVCGLAEISGQAEPFVILVGESDRDRDRIVVTLPGERPPESSPAPPPREWEFRVMAPFGRPVDGDANQVRLAGNVDAYLRQTVLRLCPDLQPPAGATWKTTPDPDATQGREQPAPRPDPRPSDEQMLAMVTEGRPNARILSYRFRDVRRGGRAGCGLVEVDGDPEPFHVSTGLPEVGASWRTRLRAPTHGDRDGDGDIDRADRNRDIADRRLALIFCEQDPIAAPEGVEWRLEIEPDPDRPRTSVTPGGPKVIPLPRPQG